MLERPALLVGEQLVAVAGEEGFGALLASRGLAPLSARTAVIAVGSNGAPAQVAYKFAARGVSCVVPMAPRQVYGLRAGVSSHVGVAGYVPAAPVLEAGASDTLVVAWLDDAQLAAMDHSERLNYRRRPAPDGSGAYVYVSMRGVLVGRSGETRVAQAQPELLSGLLRDAPRLREVFGPTPESWVRVARADEAARALGVRVFREMGWVRESVHHG
ncbi:hypothetical protein [Streptomyces boncukensis]|uniref:Uncharacterized protein n=1 Tax=Streptomyces boncukensis TaxID=2711219 RepID=A0A6G4WTX8_9ACTN|nr:hypothetical protein [Streptomyces boncukensis]NGO68665.1 hypothetical protein [Streptomyces boncukensis]